MTTMYFVLFSIFAAQVLGNDWCHRDVLLYRTGTKLPSWGPFCLMNAKEEELPEISSEFAARLTKSKQNPRSASTVQVEDGPFLVPYAFVGTCCSSTAELEIGRNGSSTCERRIDESECVHGRFLNAQDLFGKRIISVRNISTIEVEFRPANESFQSPKWSNGTCSNVPTITSIVFQLNGTEIIDAVVDIVYSNVTATSSAKQTFIYYFVPNVIEEIPVTETGIIVGKADKLYRLFVPSMGFCNDVQTSATVRRNRQLSTRCAIQLSGTDCETIRSEAKSMIDLITPDYVYNSIGSNGISVTIANITRNSSHNCLIPSGLIFDVLTAKKGPVDNYEVEIVGLIATKVLSSAMITSDSLLFLSFSVNHLDVTMEPTHQFASLPQLDLRLPRDVFYPFAQSSNSLAYLIVLTVTYVFAS